VAVRRLVRRRRDGYELRLDEPERDLLREQLGSMRSLLLAENPASDAGVARLFPPAYPDDLLQNLDYERTAGNGLLAERLSGLDEAEAALTDQRVTEARLLALLRAINDLRLIYGVRLDVTEETGRADFDDAHDRATYDVYLWLGWLMEHIVGALSEA
jgi:hypothetical protein